MGRLLAIDYGKKRTGIAVTDILQIIANGLCTVETPKLLDFLADYLSKESVERIIVGQPKQTNGEDSEKEPSRARLVVHICLLFGQRVFSYRFPPVNQLYERHPPAHTGPFGHPAHPPVSLPGANFLL